jgi:magnesium-transporting ATPase (P-type)
MTQPARIASPSWHTQEPEETLEAFKTAPTGLSQPEAEHRLQEHGENRLPQAKPRHPFMRFLAQFHNVLIYVLLISAGITALLGDWVDTGVILGVVLINASIGFIQEGKAEQALEAIRTMLSLQATVLREGHRHQVPAERVVPGDVLFLQAGDKVAADLRLLQIKNLSLQEAVLTGESEAVEKAIAPVQEDAPLGDRACMAYAGTLVTRGQGMGVVVATGQATEIGRISSLLSGVEPLTTPLLRQLSRFGRWLTVTILGLVAFTFLFGWLLRNYPLRELFLAVVGLAVAAIPEALPAILTITLALGVQSMARRNAIIRRLPAVETLGAVTVICSDKTGTLTKNEMTVQTIVTADHLFTVSGAGYTPHGEFRIEERAILVEEYPTLLESVRAGLLCNDAVLRQVGDEWHLEGDPTEGALVSVALKAGLDPYKAAEIWPRTDTIPFESEHRFMATLHHNHAGHGFIFLKGAPEQVFQRCATQRQQGEEYPLDLASWQRWSAELAATGQRLLAIASKPAEVAQRTLTFGDVEMGFTLLGLFGIIDPPREEAIAAVAECRQAGIRVKMITGDHVMTAQAIGAQLGIGLGRQALTGKEVEQLGDEALLQAVEDSDVFARSSPEHKLRLVTALQAQGQVVAMTGDGVNDAPALKRADVGVAMGIKGTEAAKEAAEMVLADDNFATIAHAVEEGRTVYDNLQKALVFILPTNGGEALTIIAALFMGLTLPITPAQILWVNTVTAVTLALALPFDPPEEDIMQRPPRDPKEPLLTRFLIWRIGFVAVLLVLGVLALFVWESGRGGPIELSRTVAVNVLVIGECVYLLNSRHLTRSALSREGVLGNRYALLAIGAVLALQMLFTYVPFMQELFGTGGIGLDAWGRILLIGGMVFFLVEAEKSLIRWRRRSRLP